ncbi:terminase small subunit [Lactococcus garvieae]|uniref:terminase small subunit n=1 Tax=Lactococcus garvieae TaxID=1363 RepID=UPI0013FDEBB8|nr:terminase small subunit [Lactococcus garvieae]NHI68997.1 terminase small subunit [Lactococcus garvieae]NHJ07555.1 terminase small subunit [Lactococcus garvieae]
MKLTEKQKKFADFYIKLGNATQAALDAGYSKRTAYSQGQRLLKNVEVKRYIEQRMEEISNERIMSAKEAIILISDIANGNITERVVVSTPVGVEEVDKPPDLKTRMMAAKEILKRYPGNDKLLEQQLRKLTAEANATEAKAKILTDSANKLEGNIKNNEMLRALVEVPIVEREEGDL